MNEAEILYKMYKTMGSLPIGNHIGVSSAGKQMSYTVTETSLTIVYESGEIEEYTE
jgi:hypothetical protein